MSNKNIYHIAIDGPAGSGKSTIAQLLAKKLAINYFSTGIIFRLYAYLWNKFFPNQQPVDEQKISFIVGYKNMQITTTSIVVDGREVIDQLNNPQYSFLASLLSQNPIVRHVYEKLIKEIIGHKSFVLDGRDIATKIMPSTPYKFFLTASVQARAMRRYHQLQKQNQLNQNCSLEQITQQIKQRDENDQNRTLSPLIPDSQAIVIDSSLMTIEQVVDKIVELIKQKEQNV